MLLKRQFYSTLTSILVAMLLTCIVSKIYCGNEEPNFDLLLKKAKSYSNKNFDSVCYFARIAYTIADKNNNPDQELDAIFTLINSNISSGKLVEAMKLCDSAKEITKQHNLEERQTGVLLHLGKVYHSMDFASEALKIFSGLQKGLSPKSSTRYKVDLLYNIAAAHYKLGDIEECHDYLRMSLDAVQEKNNMHSIFPTYLFYASTMNGSKDSIQKYLQLADLVVENHPELIYEKAVLRNNQALINEELGNIKLSKKQYHEAIEISIANSFQAYLATIYNNYAYLLIVEAKYDSTVIVLDRAMQIAQELKSIDLQASIYETYSDYYTLIRNYQTALIYKDSSITRRNQCREEQSIQKSMFLSAIIETKDNEKEILQQENRIRRLWIFMLGVSIILAVAISLVVFFRQKFFLSRAKLETVEKEKALEIADVMIHSQDEERKRLAMDLHDSLGARLSALRFLVDGFFKTNSKYHEVNSSIDNIHQNVRDLSHRMLPAQLADFGLVHVIKNMVSMINKSEKFIVEFQTNLKMRLSDNLELSIYYLLYELINNATKHSNGNTVFVQLLEHGDLLTLSVEDNGSGFEVKKNNDGLGLKNIKARVDYLGGELIIESNDSRTIFMIEIPLTVN